MFVRSVLSTYSRLLTGVSLALMAAALAGCNDTVAEKAEPPRPVLVATAHYDAETPERSFVGTVRPRIESDLGFRVAGKVAKRLVEVGQTVEIGQPLATLDEVDLKLQAEQAAAEQTAATGVLVQAAAAEQRAKDLKAKGWTTDAQMDSSRAAADEARARLNRAERVARLPLSALFNEGGKPSFYVVDDNGAVSLKPVAVKSYDSNDVIITGGVDEGAKIVALGMQKLDPSQTVRVVSSLSF